MLILVIGSRSKSKYMQARFCFSLGQVSSHSHAHGLWGGASFPKEANPPPREWGELRRAHHPAFPPCYAAGIRLALEVEIFGRSGGFLVHFPGPSLFTFSRDEARENGFPTQRRADPFHPTIAHK